MEHERKRSAKIPAATKREVRKNLKELREIEKATRKKLRPKHNSWGYTGRAY